MKPVLIYVADDDDDDELKLNDTSTPKGDFGEKTEQSASIKC